VPEGTTNVHTAQRPPRPAEAPATSGGATANAATAADPRLTWRGAPAPQGPGRAPLLRHRRDGILPATAAALSVRGATYTCTASKAEQPPALHPLVQEFLDALPLTQRERFTGRCPEALLLSQYLTGVDAGRRKRAARKPLTHSEARKALKNAKLTARRIREEGDPEHGGFAPPCRSCAPLLEHFGVRTVDTA
jgi:YwqJ-like deaminase